MMMPRGGATRLSVAAERYHHVALPGGALRRADLARTVVAHAQATALAASRGETTQLAVLVHVVAEPVDARISAHGLVMRVNHDHLVVFVHRVLRHPVRVEHAQTRARTADALLRLGAVVAAPLVLPDAAVARLAVVVAFGLNHLARTALDAHAVDAEALLGLVAKVARFVRARRTRRAGVSRTDWDAVVAARGGL